MTTPAQVLASLLGPEAIHERNSVLIASPSTTEEVATIARFANDHNLAIEITGAGTKRSWGNPVTSNLLLDTTHLTGVREHSWQDLTATVATGTRWADMQRTLAAHNQFVALDPLWPERATIGGIIATNDSGALRLRYGSLRDLILGMTIVLADGTIARSGGKVVKNVAGYDLHKLMTGAFGTLGIITEVTFRLHPLPKHCQTFTVSAPQAARLAPLMASITDSHLLVEAMQLRGDSHSFHLDIQLNAHPDAKQREALSQMARSHGLSICEAQPDCWQAREQIFAQSNQLIAKFTMLPADITTAAQLVNEAGGSSVTQAAGVMTASFEHFGKAYPLEQLIAPAGGAIAFLKTNSGTAGLDAWGDAPNSVSIMHAIKQHFDPNNTLNPARFLDGVDDI